jgi:hypothetical protein
MSSTRVWVIEILSPRDTFRSYFASRDGAGKPLWVENPAKAVHFAKRGDATETASTLGLHARRYDGSPLHRSNSSSHSDGPTLTGQDPMPFD